MILGKYEHKKQAKNPCILLLGYYVEKNTSDDAMLLAPLEQFQHWHSHTEFMVTATECISKVFN